MTWAEWVNSSYNTDGSYIAESQSIRKNGVSGHVCYDMAQVMLSDLIVEDRQYYMGNDKTSGV